MSAFDGEQVKRVSPDPVVAAKQQAWAVKCAKRIMSEVGVVTDVHEVKVRGKFPLIFKTIGKVVTRTESELIPIGNGTVVGAKHADSYARIVRSTESTLVPDTSETVTASSDIDSLPMDIADVYMLEYLQGNPDEYDGSTLTNDVITGPKVVSPKWPINPSDVNAIESMLGFTAEIIDLGENLGMRLVAPTRAH